MWGMLAQKKFTASDPNTAAHDFLWIMKLVGDEKKNVIVTNAKYKNNNLIQLV